MVSVSGIVAASAASADSGGANAAAQVWAYGVLREVNLTGSAASGPALNFAYHARETFGFAVVYNETNPSPGVYVVSVSRVMGTMITVTYCRPNCVDPSATGTISHRSWESLNGSATLVTDATVSLSNGTDVSALGLASSTLELSAGVRESAASSVGSEVLRNRSLDAHLNASENLSLTPALGLLPLNLTNLTREDTWSSASTFVSTGFLRWTYQDRLTGTEVPIPVNRSINGSWGFNSSGTVALSGRTTGATVRLSNSLYDALNLSVSGPFSLREGWLLVPTRADLFGSSPQEWSENESGATNVTQANLDVQGNVLGSTHLAVGGSGEWWFARTGNPAAAGLTGAAAPATVLSPGVMPGSNATYLQATPESPSQAATDQNCLVTGVGCPLGAPRLAGVFLGAVVVGALLVLATLAAVLVVERRRRLPPPVYPNASLYPPGTASVEPAPPTERPPSTPPPSEEEDPLAHLW